MKPKVIKRAEIEHRTRTKNDTLREQLKSEADDLRRRLNGLSESFRVIEGKIGTIDKLLGAME